MPEYKAILSKNGKGIQINLDKVWHFYLILATIIGIIVNCVVWIVNMENFKTQSKEDRQQLKILNIMTQDMLIEQNYNLREYIEYSAREHPNDSIQYNWKDIEEIKSLYKFDKLRK